ncbi:hypothetical protein D3C86_2258670 [compost metagenome]
MEAKMLHDLDQRGETTLRGKGQTMRHQGGMQGLQITEQLSGRRIGARGRLRTRTLLAQA